MSRPAVATYLTGLAPDRHRVLDDASDALPETVATLAELLGRRGFRTAAFPDSSLLGRPSGLLRGFEVVDDPPFAGFGVERLVPKRRPAAEQVENVRAWLAAIAPAERFLIWIHSTQPLERQMLVGSSAQGKEPGEPGEDEREESPGPRESDPTLRAVEEFDTALGRILDALDAVPGGVAVVLAGTFGEVSGAEDELPGMGFSLGERALRVPVVARMPAGSPALRGAGAAVWAPDVPATLARLGGVELPGSEGVALFSEVPGERRLFAWSRATLDQMGWRPQQALREAGLLRVQGLEDRTLRLGGGAGPIDRARADALAAALAARPVPAARGLSLDELRPQLEARGLALRPLPREGRDFGPASRRREAAERVWRSRVFLYRDRPRFAVRALARAAAADPDSLAALLDRGQLLLSPGGDVARGRPLLERAAALYPTSFEAVHGYVHAHWEERWREMEPVLEMLARERPGDADVLYDLACARSKAADLERAERYLRAAIEAGFRHWEGMEVDPDLRPLREAGRFAEVLREYRR
jgi:tetratricopeptide (TPR) repeat protein